jgi:hypothetical protein
VAQKKPGTDVRILKIFSPKNLAKILAFFARTGTTFLQKIIIKLVLRKTLIFSPKISKKRLKL